MDVESDYDAVMKNFKVRLRKTQNPEAARLKFNLDRLNYLNVIEEFKATIGRKFTSLLTTENNDVEKLMD